ncbi:MAG TPA: hypothetical protein PKY56_11580 [Candidatus Kapabacteria bacterium]|nr:hypothetical protein [Candidatus Kapabacteria bacterium]HPO62659.1 hypothetical protein [Candidatus Kapabacteria bacterium]
MRTQKIYYHNESFINSILPCHSERSEESILLILKETGFFTLFRKTNFRTHLILLNKVHQGIDDANNGRVFTEDEAKKN